MAQYRAFERRQYDDCVTVQPAAQPPARAECSHGVCSRPLDAQTDMPVRGNQLTTGCICDATADAQWRCARSSGEGGADICT